MRRATNEEPTTEMADQHRQKSQEELAQEARDEELARQLSMEEEALVQRAHQQLQQRPSTQPSAPQQPQQPQQQQQAMPPRVVIPPTPAGVLQMPCEVCSCINNIRTDKVHLRHLCGGCQRLLPPFDPAAMEQWASMQQQIALAAQQVATQNRRQQQQQVPQGPRGPAAGGALMLQCPVCGYGNLIPPGSNGPFLCGTCRNMLPAIAQPAPSQPPVPVQPAPARTPPAPTAAPRADVAPAGSSPAVVPAAAPPAPNDPSIVPLQGEVVRQVTSHHVRCGQCPHVNLVQSESMGEVLFRCGGCNAVNKAVFR